MKIRYRKPLKLIFYTFLLQGILCHSAQGQVVENSYNLGSFFSELKAIKPYTGSLDYDSFPDFDFIKFCPIKKVTSTIENVFVVGFSPGKEIKAIIFLKGKKRVGVMNVYQGGFNNKILTYQTDSIIARYPSIPLFCISPRGRFIVYLNTGFEFGRSYTPSNVSVVHILRDDFFPAYVLNIWKDYIRVVSEINYINGNSKAISDVRIMFIYHPEDRKKLKITKESIFSDEYDIPRADFITGSHPNLRVVGVPLWVNDEQLVYDY